MKRTGLWLLPIVVCVIVSADEIVKRVRDFEIPSHLRSWRAAARETTDDPLGVLVADPENPTPVERARLIALAWEVAPRRVVPVQADEPQTLRIVSSFANEATRSRLVHQGACPVFSNVYATVWRTKAAPTSARSSPPASVAWPRECPAVLAVLGLMGLAWWRFNRRFARPVPGRILAAAAGAFLILAAVTLTHSLLVPNGLGVQAGKAKLLYLARGVPTGFWTDRAFAVFQPAYPPGLSLTALLFDLLAGGCGERLVQVIVPGALALLFLEEAVEHRTIRTMAFCFLFVLSPVALGLAAGFYAEPLAVLCLSCGLHALRHGCRLGGAFLAGCAGFFRPEGGLVACGFLFVLLARRLRLFRPMLVLATAALPTLIWQLVCLLTGATLADVRLAEGFSFTSSFSFGRALVKNLLCFWTTGGILFLVFAPGRRRRSALSGAFLILAVFAVLAGFHHSPHFDWVAATYAPRLVWMVLAGACACLKGAEEWKTC